LEGAVIAVTEETSTSALLLRLLLEQRYRLTPAAYEPRRVPEADALLLIGDEALRFRAANAQYPYEVDLGFEWWLWQHLPCVFAVWAVRKTVEPPQKRHLEAALARALAANTAQLDAVARQGADTLSLPAADLAAYLAGFHYRFGPEEEAGIARFEELAHEHHLL
jgi:chorismate dehydratase